MLIVPKTFVFLFLAWLTTAIIPQQEHDALNYEPDMSTSWKATVPNRERSEQPDVPTSDSVQKSSIETQVTRTPTTSKEYDEPEISSAGTSSWSKISKGDKPEPPSHDDDYEKYLVFLENLDEAETNKKVWDDISSLNGVDKKKIEYIGSNLGMSIYIVPLSKDNVEKVEAMHGVGTVIPESEEPILDIQEDSFSYENESISDTTLFKRARTPDTATTQESNTEEPSQQQGAIHSTTAVSSKMKRSEEDSTSTGVARRTSTPRHGNTEMFSYVILLADPHDFDINTKIWNTISQFDGVQKDNMTIAGDFERNGFGLYGIEAPLTKDYVKQVEVMEGVKVVTLRSEVPRLNIQYYDDPRASWEAQTWRSSHDLAFLSQPQDHSLNDLRGTYIYEREAGRDVTVYLFEDNVDTSGPEFASARQRNGIRVQGPQYTYNQVTHQWIAHGMTNADPNHGTGMLSKILGRECGSAKEANVVVARMPPLYDMWHLMRTLSWVNYDWVTRARSVSPHKLGIISMSWGNQIGLNGPYLQSVAMEFKKLVDQGIMPVAAAGNEGRNHVSQLPAVFAKPGTQFHVAGMTVVGGVDLQGALWREASGRGSNWDAFVSLAGPAKDSRVYYHGLYTHMSGTSPTTAAVAGMAAVFASSEHSVFLGDQDQDYKQKVLRLKEHLENLAYPRGRTTHGPNGVFYPQAAWNEATWGDYLNVCGGGGPVGGHAKRQQGGTCPLIISKHKTTIKTKTRSAQNTHRTHNVHPTITRKIDPLGPVSPSIALPSRWITQPHPAMCKIFPNAKDCCPGISTGQVCTKLPYPYTFSGTRGEVVECATISTFPGPLGMTLSSCAGESSVLETGVPIPTPTMTQQIGKGRVKVGTLTGNDLWSSVSTALASACPKPTAHGAATSCNSDWITISPGIDWLEHIGTMWDLETGGVLELQATNANYTHEHWRQALIKAAATAVNASTSHSCKQQSYWPGGWAGEHVRKTIHECHVTDFAGPIIFPKSWKDHNGQEEADLDDMQIMDVILRFKETPDGEVTSIKEDLELCEEITDLFLSLITAADPELFAGLPFDASQIIEPICGKIAEQIG